MNIIKRRNIELPSIDEQIVKSIIGGYTINNQVTLSSGRRSSCYYDIKSLILNNVDWNQIKNILIQDIKSKFPEVVCVAGQGIGGISLAMRIASSNYNISALLLRDNQKEHGLLKQVEGHCPNGTPRCVVVDDVATTGKSFRKSNKILNTNGIKVLGNYVLLKRKESHFDCECLISL